MVFSARNSGLEHPTVARVFSPKAADSLFSRHLGLAQVIPVLQRANGCPENAVIGSF